jgi:hypothetical protein
MGSSRAMHHYNPEIISDSLGMTCFNAGWDGQGILYHKALLDVIMKRHIPKIVILDVNMNELDESKSSYDNLFLLNPYVRKYPVLWDELRLKPFENIKHLSSIYPFNSLLAKIIKGNSSFQNENIKDNGFMPLSGVWNDDIKETKYSREKTLDTKKREIFNTFIDKCQATGIKVYVVASPIFEKTTNNSISINYIANKCQKEKISFISYQNNNKFIDNRLFRDPLHLNDVGANILSSDIASLIKKSYR